MQSSKTNMSEKNAIPLRLAPPMNPTTFDECQNAVDAAKALRPLHGFRDFCSVVAGPQVDVERCDEVLERGRQLGVGPNPDAVERYVSYSTNELCLAQIFGR
jgi:hypothetical protein